LDFNTLSITNASNGLVIADGLNQTHASRVVWARKDKNEDMKKNLKGLPPTKYRKLERSSILESGH
jgi:hypothetical protein